MLSTVATSVAPYAALSEGPARRDVLSVMEYSLDLYLDRYEQGQAFTDADLLPFRHNGARRAAQHVSLEAVLSAYQVGQSAALRSWFSVYTRPAEHEQLFDMAMWGMLRNQLLNRATSAGYLEAQQLAAEAGSARRALVEALLRGAAAEELAERVHVTLAPGYVVVVARCWGTELSPALRPAAQLRRQFARVLEVVEPLGVLGTTTRTGAVVLVPAHESSLDRARDAAEGLAAELVAAGSVPVTAGLAWRPRRADLPHADAEAREVVRLAIGLERPPGVYDLADVALEALLSRPGAARDRLAGLLAPLRTRPALLQTLEHWFASDFDRRGAAAALHIHPKTLDYRLRRVADLTGMSTSTTRGFQALGAALVVLRLQHRGLLEADQGGGVGETG